MENKQDQTILKKDVVLKMTEHKGDKLKLIFVLSVTFSHTQFEKTWVKIVIFDVSYSQTGQTFPYCWWKKSCTTWDVKTTIDKLPTSTGDFFHHKCHLSRNKINQVIQTDLLILYLDVT